MSLNIQESQKNAICQILDLSSDTDVEGDDSFDESSMPNVHSPPTNHYSLQNAVKKLPQSESSLLLWKILIFDKNCQNIISPLLKVGTLRQCGVTLHLPIDKERSSVCEVPAVYFVDPTEENINIIIEDLRNGLYQSFYLYFNNPLNPHLIERLAKAVAQDKTMSLVKRVREFYLNFIALSPYEFSLNMPNVFQMLRGQTVDSEIENAIERMALGLLAVLMTLGLSIPIIRCPKDATSPAYAVAQRLNKAIIEYYNPNELNPNAPLQRIMSSAGSALNLHRPLFIILDRDIDMQCMVQHTWLYQPLLHDLFNLKLNRVQVVDDETEKTPLPSNMSAKFKTYDLDIVTDKIWEQYLSKPISQVAVAVTEALSDYNKKMKDISCSTTTLPSKNPKSWNVSDTGLTDDLTSAVSALPEMAERKRSIDMHTNIATALVNEIRKRKLDKFFESEEDFNNGLPMSYCINQLTEIFGASPELGNDTDKARLVLSLFLSKENVSSSHLETIRSRLADLGDNIRALEYLEQRDKFKRMNESLRSQLAQPSPPTSMSQSSMSSVPTAATGTATAAAAWGTKVIESSKGLFQGVKNLFPIKREMPITKIADSLLSQKDSRLSESFAYFDPKSNHLGFDAPQLRGSFKLGIVFVVGGGNYVESIAIKEYATRTVKQVIYGTTDFVSPADFLSELISLGKSASTG